MRAVDVLLTDEKGRPMPRPQRHEYAPGGAGTEAFIHALHGWRDRITAVANRAFDEAFKKEMG